MVFCLVGVLWTALGSAAGLAPLSFEANRGQTDAQVHYLARGRGYNLFLTAREAVLAGRAGTARLRLLGSNPQPAVSGLEELPGKSNYFIGRDPARWRTDIPTYARVEYRGVYPGIDLAYYGNERQLEFDWVVAPGADPALIRFTVEGAGQPRLEAGGDLAGRLRVRKPVAYQTINGRRQEVEARFLLQSEFCNLQLGSYDRSLPLVIDPQVLYFTFLGGSSDDQARALAVDSAGNTYVAGLTFSTNFPTSTGAFQNTGGFGNDVFVTKLNAAGSAVLYSTYLRGSGQDQANGIAVDSAGNAFVCGQTNSGDFPFTPLTAYQPAFQGGFSMGDAFVTKLNSTGSGLLMRCPREAHATSHTSTCLPNRASPSIRDARTRTGSGSRRPTSST